MEPHEIAGGVVLYVEDDRLNIALVEEIVALVPGARLRVEGTVAGAVASLHADPPSIVLVDLDLPDGSGFDVVAAVRGLSRRPPVLVLTGDVSDRAAAMAAEYGADGVLVKPYRISELLTAIESAVSA